MDLSQYSDHAILTNTKYFLIDETTCALKILSHLAENRKRKLYAGLGHGSIFDYCVKDLGLSHSETQRRLSSAKLLSCVPEAGELISQGELSLSALSYIQGHINHQEKNTKKIVSDEDKKKLVISMKGKSTRQVERDLLAIQEASGTHQPPRQPQFRQVGSKDIRFHVTLSSETFELLKKAKSYATKTKEISWEEFFQKMAQNFIQNQFPKMKRKMKRKRKENENVGPTPPSKPKKSSRYIPMPVQEHVWKRSGGICEFISAKTGRRCDSLHRLNYGHDKAFAKGGKSTKENIKLLCFEHNAYEAMMEFPQQYDAAVLTAGKLKMRKGKKNKRE